MNHIKFRKPIQMERASKLIRGLRPPGGTNCRIAPLRRTHQVAEPLPNSEATPETPRIVALHGIPCRAQSRQGKRQLAEHGRLICRDLPRAYVTKTRTTHNISTQRAC
jgi:hypothetical protein